MTWFSSDRFLLLVLTKSCVLTWIGDVASWQAGRHPVSMWDRFREIVFGFSCSKTVETLVDEAIATSVQQLGARSDALALHSSRNGDSPLTRGLDVFANGEPDEIGGDS